MSQIGSKFQNTESIIFLSNPVLAKIWSKELAFLCTIKLFSYRSNSLYNGDGNVVLHLHCLNEEWSLLWILTSFFPFQFLLSEWEGSTGREIDWQWFRRSGNNDVTVFAHLFPKFLPHIFTKFVWRKGIDRGIFQR